ncbi:MAG: response regulator [Acidimicrobiales bacterium]
MSTLPEILVVDDDPLVRETLGCALDQQFVVRFAASGDEAIAALALDPPAVMLLDLDMPGVDGFEVLEVRRQRRLAARTRVVMLSADDDERSVLRSWVLGADSYLTKPIDAAHISARLRTLLAPVEPARTPSTA